MLDANVTFICSNFQVTIVFEIMTNTMVTQCSVYTKNKLHKNKKNINIFVINSKWDMHTFGTHSVSPKVTVLVKWKGDCSSSFKAINSITWDHNMSKTGVANSWLTQTALYKSEMLINIQWGTNNCKEFIFLNVKEWFIQSSSKSSYDNFIVFNDNFHFLQGESGFRIIRHSRVLHQKLIPVWCMNYSGKTHC